MTRALKKLVFPSSFLIFSSVRQWGFCLLFLCWCIPGFSQIQSQYLYDDLGRLLQASGSDGAIVQYQYDANGNVLAINRFNSGTFSIATFQPMSGPIGTVVTINGSGFGSQVADNVVTLGGVTVPVLTATASSLTVKIPAGSVSGALSVTVSGDTRTTASPFVVTSLSLSSFSPVLGTVGTLVTVNGGGFDANKSHDSVSFGGASSTPQVASTVQLQTAVPAGALSGRITVTTPVGSVQSADDFYVIPAGMSLGNIDSYGRVALDTAGKVFTFSNVGKSSLALFDGAAGQYVALLFTNVSVSGGTFSIYRPDGALFYTGNLQNNAAYTLPALPTAGTYVVVMTDNAGWGSATLAVKSALIGDLAATGINVGYSIAPNQIGWMSFEGTAGKSYSLALTNLTSSPSGAGVGISFIKPDGTTFTSGFNCTSFSASSGNCDISALPVSGTYRIKFTPSSGYTVSFNAVLAQTIEAGTLTPNAASITTNSILPGQNSIMTFSGSSGQRLSLYFSANTVPTGALFIFKPDGSLLDNTTTGGIASGVLDLPVLTVAGNYTVFIFRDNKTSGSITLRLLQEASGTMSADGTAYPLSLAPGQNARLTFSGVAGKGYSLALTSITTGTVAVSFLKPDGTSYTSGYSCGSFTSTSGNCDISPLPVTGTYTLILNPTGTSGPSLSVVISPDVEGSMAVSQPLVHTSTFPGQNGRYVLSGTAGQNLSLTYTAEYLNAGTIYVFKPDGSYLANITLYKNSSSSTSIPTLPAAGNYTVIVFSDGSSAGSVTVKIVPR